MQRLGKWRCYAYVCKQRRLKLQHTDEQGLCAGREYRVAYDKDKFYDSFVNKRLGFTTTGWKKPIYAAPPQRGSQSAVG